MSLAYSSLDELYGQTNSKDTTNLTLKNVENEALCKLRKPKPKAKKTKHLGRYAEYEGSDIENRNKIITTQDVSMTDLHKATLDCKNKAREQQNVEGFTKNDDFANFQENIMTVDDFNLKKYILNEEEMSELENNMMYKTQNDGIKNIKNGFMSIHSNEVENTSKKKKNKKKTKDVSNDDDDDDDDDIDIDETIMDKYMNLLLYILSGILLILLMEQILQLGIKMKM